MESVQSWEFDDLIYNSNNNNIATAVAIIFGFSLCSECIIFIFSLNLYQPCCGPPLPSEEPETGKCQAACSGSQRYSAAQLGFKSRPSGSNRLLALCLTTSAIKSVSSTCWLYDLHASDPSWASVSSSVKWGLYYLHCGTLMGLN